MAEDSKKKPSKDDERAVVDSLLSDMGVDDDMRRELIASGRLQGDVFKVESSEEVRRRTDIGNSLERLRASLNLVERSVSGIEASIDRVERDLVPVVLSFLVGLKGNLVTLRNTVIDKGKRRAKTSLQATYVNVDMRAVVEEEFARVEETLTSGMSAPILERLRDITEGLRDAAKLTLSELATLKAGVDDLVQRTTTEVEYLSKEMSMKPKVLVPKETEEKLKAFERRVDELTRDLTLSSERLANRESEIDALTGSLTDERTRGESLGDALDKLKASPAVDLGLVTELRQNIKALETTKSLLSDKLRESDERADEAEEKRSEALSTIAERDLAIEDLKTQVSELQNDVAKANDSLAELDQSRARIRSLESGDMVRESERIKGDVARLKSSFDRLTVEHDSTKQKLTETQFRLNGYLALMGSTEKTKAFLMLEEAGGELALREIQRSLGVSPALVSKWVEDFERLGIAKRTEKQTLVLTKPEV